MREIDDAREALSRVENNLERYRWIIRNPRRARNLLSDCLNYHDANGSRMRRDDLAAIQFAKLIDEERAETRPIPVPPARQGWQCANPACDCYDTQRQKLHYGPKHA